MGDGNNFDNDMGSAVGKCGPGELESSATFCKVSQPFGFVCF